MAGYALFPIGGLGSQMFDADGKPLAGGEVWTYIDGTDTPLDTWSDNEGRAKRTNPIILDSAGRVPDSGLVYLVDGQPYRFVIRRRDTIYETITTGGDPAPPYPANTTEMQAPQVPPLQAGVYASFVGGNTPENSDVVLAGDADSTVIIGTFFANYELEVLCTSAGAYDDKVQFWLEYSASRSFVSVTNLINGAFAGPVPIRVQGAAGFYRVRVKTTQAVGGFTFVFVSVIGVQQP